MSSTHAAPADGDNARAADRRDEILAAARAAIEEHGPGALTGQIAKYAGLARPNVYRHFASKDDLDLALARRAYKELRRAITGRLDLSGSPLDVVRAPIEAQVNWAEHHPNLYRFLVSRGQQRAAQGRRSDERSDLAAVLADAGGRYFPGFADDADAAEATLVATIGLVDASVLRWLDRHSEGRDKLIARLTAQCWLLIDHHLHEHGIHVNPTRPLPQPSTSNPTD
jgi:AcrR family transcriptional regulator